MRRRRRDHKSAGLQVIRVDCPGNVLKRVEAGWSGWRQVSGVIGGSKAQRKGLQQVRLCWFDNKTGDRTGNVSAEDVEVLLG